MKAFLYCLDQCMLSLVNDTTKELGTVEKVEKFEFV